MVATLNKYREQRRRFYRINRIRILETAKARYKAEREIILGRAKDYWRKNRDAILRRKKKYYNTKKKSILLKNKKYYLENKESILGWRRKYFRERKLTDVQFRLGCLLRDRINKAIKGSYKSGCAVRDLGCTIGELKTYLEGKFKDGMTWENWGRQGWNLDHQPLWESDNIRKRDKLSPNSIIAP